MPDQYLTAKEAIRILQIPESTFYRFVKEGKITKYYVTTVSKHGKYDSKEIARLKSAMRAEKPRELGKVSLIQPDDGDMGAIYNLEFPIYGEQTGNPQIVRKWYQRNPYACWVLHNKVDRKDIWGAISTLPLEEETILKILRGEIRDVDLDPAEIKTFDKPGEYYLYIPTVIIHPTKRIHFMLLINAIFDYWCSIAPQCTIHKIYGRIISPVGEMIARRLFFSPLWHLSDDAYVLDLTRPNPSKIVQSFQYCVQRKREQTEK